MTNRFSFDAYQKDCAVIPQLGMTIGMCIGVGIAVIISYPIWVVFAGIKSLLTKIIKIQW